MDTAAIYVAITNTNAMMEHIIVYSGMRHERYGAYGGDLETVDPLPIVRDGSERRACSAVERGGADRGDITIHVREPRHMTVI